MIRDHRVYKTRKVNRSSLIWGFVIRTLFLLFILYQVITVTLVSTVKIRSASMEPFISPGDAFLTSPLNYGFSIPFTDWRFQGTRAPARGDIALMIPPYNKQQPVMEKFSSRMIRFVTLGKKDGRRGPGNSSMVKRIIGVPGDTVKIEGFEAFIRPPGQDVFISEKKMIPFSYELKIERTTAWESEFPLGGHMEPVTLEEGEFFLLGDNRTGASDSRYFGVVKKESMVSRLILRYHPLTRFKIP